MPEARPASSENTWHAQSETEFVTDESASVSPMMDLVDEQDSHGAPARSDDSPDWLDRTFQSHKKRKRKQYQVHQTDCPFGVLLMGILLVGIQLVTALLAVVSMVRGIATPELWGRLVGSLIGLGIAWGYLSGQKAALRLYQFLGGLQIVALVAAAIAAREFEPLGSIALGLVAVVAVGIYFYNFAPAVESYFRGEPVRYPFYLTSWHFYVPLSVCVVGIMGGYGASLALQEAMEQQRWALNADPSQVALVTATNVTDQARQQQIESRVQQLVGGAVQMKSEWNVSRQRLRMAVAPVADLAAFSQRLDFGQVKRVNGRLIEIEVNPAALEAIAKAAEAIAQAAEENRKEAARKAAEVAAAQGAQNDQFFEELQRRSEEVKKQIEASSAQGNNDSAERQKHFWETASGPGWVLERQPGKPGELFTHRQAGYRIVLPTSYEINRAVNTIRTVNPTEGRDTIMGFGHSRAGALAAILRIETYTIEEEDKPIDVLRKWDKARRGNSAYKRSAGFQEDKLGDLPCAGIAYTWKDRDTDAQLELWLVRRDERLYAVTIGATRSALSWSWAANDLRKAMQSFELFDAKDESDAIGDSSASSLKSAGSAQASRRQLQHYPINIALPASAVRVTAETPLRQGIKLGCSWGGSWNNVTVLALNDDGTVRIHWDDFGNAWDGDISRACLIIEKKLLKERD